MIFPGKLSVPQCRKFQKEGILWCFINFGYRKTLDQKKREENPGFLSRFLSHSDQNFRREPFCAMF